MGSARLLIVEDHAALADSLAAAFAVRAAGVSVARTAEAALAALDVRAPDWLLLDLQLPDGSGLAVLREARRRSPSPRVVALSSSATPREAFELARLGVAAYFEKPADLDALERAFVEPAAVDLASQVRLLVGARSLASIEDEVRSSIVDEALARAGGSKSRAARLLSISRQLLQHIVRGRS